MNNFLVKKIFHSIFHSLREPGNKVKIFDRSPVNVIIEKINIAVHRHYPQRREKTYYILRAKLNYLIRPVLPHNAIVDSVHVPVLPTVLWANSE